MKFEQNRRYFILSVYAFFTALAVIICYLLLSNLNEVQKSVNNVIGIAIPFIWGISLAYVLNPAVGWFERKLVKIPKMGPRKKINRGLSILLVYTLVITFLLVFFSLVIPEVSQSITRLLGNLSENIFTVEQWVSTHMMDYLDKLELSNTDMQKFISPALEYISQIDEYITTFIPIVFNFIVSAGLSLKNVLIAAIVSIYLLIGKETFVAQSKKIIFAFANPERTQYLLELCSKSNKIFSGFISGKILDSIIIGLICFVILSIFKINYAVLISVIIGVTNIIPFFGPFIGAIPSVLLLLIVDPKQALFFAVFILILQQFDGNILGPKILGESTGLSAFWVIFAVIFSGGLFGVVGMFIGVPVFAVIYTLVKAFVEAKLAKKDLPIDTSAYTVSKTPLQKEK